MPARKLIIVGGGAAGFFAAINAAEVAKKHNISVSISILEASDFLLKKVRISGGGRCNVTHNIFDVREFVKRYPRGYKELISPYQRFQARDTVEWFRERGVKIVAEDDGRMFPSTDTSATIIECFMSAAAKAGVDIKTGCGVQSIIPLEMGGFRIMTTADTWTADAVLIATGSSQIGYRLARELGHTITELAPSLFSFKIVDKLLTELPGLSFENAKVRLSVPEAERPKLHVFEEQGPLLITHWGLSGPAVLKISAWAAREMMHADYKAILRVNWLGLPSLEIAHKLVREMKEQEARAVIENTVPQGMAKRFWAKFLEVNDIKREKKWAEVSRAELNRLGEQLYATDFEVAGKNRYKDEFVECGGVSLKEIDFKTMQSRKHPGLFFAGEILDIDGITGGFNFQNAWTGGWIAAHAMLGATEADTRS